MKVFKIYADVEKFGKGIGPAVFNTAAPSAAKATSNARFQAWEQFGRAAKLCNVKVKDVTPEGAVKQMALF